MQNIILKKIPTLRIKYHFYFADQPTLFFCCLAVIQNVYLRINRVAISPFGRYQKIAIKKEIFDTIKRVHENELIHAGILKKHKEESINMNSYGK